MCVSSRNKMLTSRKTTMLELKIRKLIVLLINLIVSLDSKSTKKLP